jgi:glutathione S-transferase
MIDGRAFIGGDEISLADVLLYCFLNFGKAIGQPYDTSLANIHNWFESINARESASA